MRYVSWRAGKNEINRNPGQFADDAPVKVLREFVALGAVEDVSDG